MTIQNLIMMMILIGGISLGCTAMTDFDAPDDKIDVSDELHDEDIDVTLNADVGVVGMTFGDELPVDDQDEIFAMIGEEITIIVSNSETSVGVEIATQPVDGTPSAPGEYQVSISSDNRTISVTFYNEAIGGQQVRPGVTYQVMIDVADNPYVETGSYVFEVTVD